MAAWAYIQSLPSVVIATIAIAIAGVVFGLWILWDMRCQGTDIKAIREKVETAGKSFFTPPTEDAVWDNQTQQFVRKQDPFEIQAIKDELKDVRENITRFKDTVPDQSELSSHTLTQWHDRISKVEHRLDRWLRTARLKF